MITDLQVAPSLPYSRENEEATIGAVLINPEIYYEIARFLKAKDFYVIRHIWIWEAFEILKTKQIPIDLLTLSEQLETAGHLQEMGGSAYLTALINQVPSSLNAESYARVVCQHSERRQGIALANHIAASAYDEGKDFSITEQALYVSFNARNNSKRIDTTEAARLMLDMMDKPDFCTTGIRSIDNKIGGLFPAELSILAGYQGTGKSAAKLQGARENAKRGKKVVLADLEMTAAQTWFRVSCGDLNVDMNQVRTGNISSETKGKIMSYAAELAEYYKDKIIIYQAPMSPGDILTAAMLERPDILYVDTLKNVSGKPARENTRDWYDYILNFLRINVAQQTGAHVQVLHHINRSTFKESRKPSMHDLMFSGESDADAIFILYRKQEDYAVINNGAVKTVVPVTWITDKSRFGWTGEEDINFKLVNQSFFGMDKQHEDYTDK